MNESFTASEAMVKMETGLPIFSEPGVVYQYNDISSVRGNHAVYYTRYYAWDLDRALEISDKYTWFKDHKGERFYLFEWDMSPERALYIN